MPMAVWLCGRPGCRLCARADSIAVMRPGNGADLAISCPSQGAGRFHPPLHHLLPSAQSYWFSSAQSYETFWRAAPTKLLFARSHQLAWACCSVLQRRG